MYGYLQEKGGLYHCAGGGSCSRYEWAKAILELDPKKEEQVVKEILPAKTSDFPTPANRPLVSVLESEFFRANLLGIDPWKEELKRQMEVV